MPRDRGAITGEALCCNDISITSSLNTRSPAVLGSFVHRLTTGQRAHLTAVSAIASKPVTVEELTDQLDIGQSTCSHHLRELAEVGFVRLCKQGTTTLVSVNPSCCTDYRTPPTS